MIDRARPPLAPSPAQGDARAWVIVSLAAHRALAFAQTDAGELGAPSMVRDIEAATRFTSRRAASAVASHILNGEGHQAAKAMQLGDALRYLAHKSQ